MSSQNPNSDAWLDAELRDVSLPVGLLERLRSIAVAGDEELDAAIRDVPVPVGLGSRLQRIWEAPVRLARLAPVATAASLLLVIGLSYVGSMAGFLWPIYIACTSPPSPPPGLESQLTVVLSLEPEGPTVGFEGPETALLGRGPGDVDAADPGPSVPEVHLAGLGTPVRAPMGQIDQFIPLPGVNLLEDLNLARWPVFAAHRGFDELKDLAKVAGLKPRGIDFPLVPPYDIAFLGKTGFHPFVAPAAHPRLRSVVVPLGVDTSSYDLTRRYLEDGELPPRETLRTEEFLAAIDYQFPRPGKGALGLHLSGGPAPFRESGDDFRRLQFGVQAREAGDGARPATRLTLAVDVSASMRWGGRLEMTRRALAALVGQIRPEDRISLVGFSEDAHVLVEQIGGDREQVFLAAVDSLTSQNSTNLGAGLRLAYAVAQHGALPSRMANRVVLLTDALAELDPASRDRIEERLVDAATRGITLDVVDLRRKEEQEEADPLLTALARAGGGCTRRATDADQVRWALLEVLTGNSQLVAADAKLKVTFNPNSVAAYRLFGHEPRSITGLKPAAAETDFYAGQSGTALFEIRLRRSSEKEVAVAELSWRDPRTGEAHQIVRRFRRGQFAGSLIEAPLWLQAATVAAEAVEGLRISPLDPAWPSPRPLADMLSLARQVDTRLQQRDSFIEFISVIEQAEAVSPSRSGGNEGRGSTR